MQSISPLVYNVNFRGLIYQPFQSTRLMLRYRGFSLAASKAVRKACHKNRQLIKPHLFSPKRISCDSIFGQGCCHGGYRNRKWRKWQTVHWTKLPMRRIFEEVMSILWGSITGKDTQKYIILHQCYQIQLQVHAYNTHTYIHVIHTTDMSLVTYLKDVIPLDTDN